MQKKPLQLRENLEPIINETSLLRGKFRLMTGGMECF
jgi:hypothetical protein